MKKFMVIICTFFISCSASSPIFLTVESKVDGAELQPRKALKIAEEHFDKHGTVVWKDKVNLKTHIIKNGKYYYIKRSDYPAKTARWYLSKSIRIHSQNGKIEYID